MVKLRVSFPKLKQYRNYLDLESWIVWEQVYGPDEDEQQSSSSSDR